jgi:hypothetical protein
VCLLDDDDHELLGKLDPGFNFHAVALVEQIILLAAR